MFALITFYEWNLNSFGTVLCNRGWFELQDLGPSPWSLWSGDLSPSSWPLPASSCRCHISGSHFPICNMKGLDTRTLVTCKCYNSMSLLVIWFIHQNKYWWKSQEEHTLDFQASRFGGGVPASFVQVAVCVQVLLHLFFSTPTSLYHQPINVR